MISVDWAPSFSRELQGPIKFRYANESPPYANESQQQQLLLLLLLLLPNEKLKQMEKAQRGRTGDLWLGQSVLIHHVGSDFCLPCFELDLTCSRRSSPDGSFTHVITLSIDLHCLLSCKPERWSHRVFGNGRAAISFGHKFVFEAASAISFRTTRCGINAI